MKHIRLAPFDLPVAVFWVSALLGLCVIYDPALGRRAFLTLSGMALLYGFIARAASNERHWSSLGAVLVGLCALVALYFVTQAGHLAYDEKVGIIDRATRWVSTIFPAFPIWQPFPNSLATFLEGGVFLATGLALLEKRPRWRAVCWAATGIIVTALLFSSSRGAWLGVLGAALLWAAVHWKPARWLAWIAAAGMLAMILFVLIRHDLYVLADIPIIGPLAGALFIRPDRLEVYRHSLALLSEQPFTGIGLGDSFSMIYSRYELLMAVPYLYYSHNLFLEVWLQQGLPGAAAFLWLIAALYTSAFRYRDFKKDLRFQAACAGLTATLLHGLSDARQYPSLWTWLPFFFLLGLCTARLLASQPPAKSRLVWAVPCAVSTGFLIIVLAINWPLDAAWNANRAALLQIRVDLDESLSQEQRLTMRSRSEELYQRALIVNPANVQINRRYGLLLLEEDRFSEAIPHLEAGYDTSADHMAARKGLGLAHMWNGNIERAEDLLKGMPRIIDELNGLAWQECYDFQHYQNALYTYQLLDHISPGQADTQGMIQGLQERLQNVENE